MEQIKEIKGWKWNFIAGFGSVTIGLLTLITTWWSILHPYANWWLGTSNLDFKFESMRLLGKNASPYYTTIASVGGINVTILGVAIIFISKNALRFGQKWAWYFLLVSFLCVGLHDAAALTFFFAQTGQPLLVFAYAYCALMLTGLLVTKPQIFK